MADEDRFRIGGVLVLNVDGHQVRGTIKALRPGALVVGVPVRQAAKGYNGLEAVARLPGGGDVSFDMGESATFTELELAIPVPGLAMALAEDKGDGPPERRHFYRLDVELEVAILEVPPGKRPIEVARGRTTNISGGGFLAELDRPMMPGVYHLWLALPGGAVECPGRLIAKGPVPSRTMAGEFMQIPEVERSRVIRFIFQRLRKGEEKPGDPTGEGKREANPSTENRSAKRRERFFKPSKPRFW